MGYNGWTICVMMVIMVKQRMVIMDQKLGHIQTHALVDADPMVTLYG